MQAQALLKKKRRQYDNDYPSVTQVLDVLRKIGLENWFKVNTLQFIQSESAKGKLVGTQIHEAIETYLSGGEVKVETEYKEEVMNALKSFISFKKENPSILFDKSEMQLTSQTYKFNGTVDHVGGGLILDWKTATAKDKDKPDIYDEYKYQVAAYVHLYNENHGTSLNEAIIVSLAKDKVAYNMYKMNKEEIDDCFYEVFLPALRILNYKKRKG